MLVAKRISILTRLNLLHLEVQAQQHSVLTEEQKNAYQERYRLLCEEFDELLHSIPEGLIYTLTNLNMQLAKFLYQPIF